MKKALLPVLPLLVIWTTSFASSFYVSPNATASGDGSMANPWTLQTAFNHPVTLKPDDTVWMLGGTYAHTELFDPSFGNISYNVKTHGQPNAPIIFRNYDNQRVTLDGENNQIILFLGNCSNTWFWGIEIMSSAAIRSANRSYIYCTAPNMKFINLILHDMADGIDLWNAAKSAELYGCLIYHNGWDQFNPNLAHGHGIYTQNDTTNTRLIENNIFFSSYAYNMKLWSTNQGIDNYTIKGNIVFNGGAASEFSDSRKANLFIVSNNPNRPIRNLNLRNNYTYAGNINAVKGLCNILSDGEMINAQVDSNYFLGQLRGLGPFTNISATDNKIYGGTALNLTNNPALFDSTFNNTTQSQNIPSSGLEYFVMPNAYEPGRANIVIYNWENADQVQVDISGIGMKPGDLYELVHAMDYFNDISLGIYPADGLITVPMTGHTFVPVISGTVPPVSQFPTFGAFVIRKALVQTPAPEIQLVQGTTSIVSGSTYNFGTTALGTDLTRPFVIRNTGVLPLTLGQISPLPSGFSLTGAFPSSPIPAGDSASFQMTLDGSILNNPSGIISFATNDPDENPFQFTINGLVTIPGYCDAKVAQPQFIWITEVALNGINKLSDGSGYSDFTSTTLTAAKGTTIPITLAPGFNPANVGQQYDVTWTIWMDLNHDYDFSDPGELVLTADGDTHHPLISNIAIPDQDVTTRMRVSMCLKGFGEVPLDCGLINYGEVEDYTIKIGSGSGPTSTFHPSINKLIQVSPNPFSSECAFQLTHHIDTRYYLQISNMHGNLIYQAPFETDRIVLQRGSWTPGVYSYVVSDEQGKSVQAGQLIVH